MNLTFIQAQNNSVLATGDWYKIAVTKNSIYKIDAALLQNIGISGTFDPKKIQVFGNGGGMLPQENSKFRHFDLVENSIFIEGEEDGSFDANDYILFYGQDPDRYYFDSEINKFVYEQNVYSDTAYYFITVGENEGKRLGVATETGTGFEEVNSYDYYEAHELDDHTVLSSGREWYGERFDITLNHSFDFDIDNIMDNSLIKIYSAVMGQTFAPAKLDISITGFDVGEINIPSVADSRYGIKGKDVFSEFEMLSSLLNGSKPTINLSFTKGNATQSRAFLNYLLLTCQRFLTLSNGALYFRSIKSTQNVNSVFEIEDANSESVVWDISDPLNPILQESQLSGSILSFGTNTQELKEFAAINLNALPQPQFVKKIRNQNIKGRSSSDLVIVTTPDFIFEANRLADFRRSNDGITVNVVTVEQVYNEFSSGAQDVTAIRDYMTFLNNNGGVKYLLLFGESSYDYKYRQFNNTNLVPIYQSRNSLDPVDTYASDDYFGFLDENEGEWLENSSGDHELDIGIGRLPVATIEEARGIVDKLINYENKGSLGTWRKEVYFIADDGNNNLHIRNADELANLVFDNTPEYDINKIYLDAHKQTSLGSITVSPETNKAIEDAIDQGALVVNYTGHGGETGWTDERILDNEMVSSWTNINKLPLFVTATCEFGRHDDPKRRSGGELLVLNPKGGAIGLLTTARPVDASSNQAINRAFFSSVFAKEDDKHLRLGDVIRLTKNNSLRGAGNRNFILLGDPSMTLAYPKKKIKLLELNENTSLSDTISALSLTTLRGAISDINGIVDTNFNGTVFLTLYDKESMTETLGNEDPKTFFTEQRNVLYNGEASVENGLFNIEFIVPKNIDYQFGKGKVTAYAISEETGVDASGANNQLIVGGSEVSVPIDVTPPIITLYMDDTSFIDGGLTGSRTHLVAKLEDESGINVSNIGVGQNITATLDGFDSYNLNDFYIADPDTYQSGWVNFPIFDLEPGEHQITLKAWDTYNNPAEEVINFFVVNGSTFTIRDTKNFPNPFSSNTTFSFDHNRAGEDLEVTLQIFSSQGQLIHENFYRIENSTSRVNNLHWSTEEKTGKKLENGVYLYRLLVRSTSDGEKNQSFQKLIIIN